MLGATVFLAIPSLSSVANDVDRDGSLGRHQRSCGYDGTTGKGHRLSHCMDVSDQRQHNVVVRGLYGGPRLRHRRIALLFRWRGATDVRRDHAVDIPGLLHLTKSIPQAQESDASPSILHLSVPQRQRQQRRPRFGATVRIEVGINKRLPVCGIFQSNRDGPAGRGSQANQVCECVGRLIGPVQFTYDHPTGR